MVTEYKAEDLVALIRKRYATESNGYNPCVVLEQVPDGTGMFQSRWIDVAVFQMWASKGLTRSAFEVKVSRSDFLSELQHPEKHFWCKESFHHFWFVAPKGVIQLEELPDRAGWMYPRGQKLYTARAAKTNENPKLDDHLLAAFLRAAHKEIEKSRQVNLEEALSTSEAYKKASSYMEATRKFLESRGNSYFIPDSTGDIIKALEEATMDKQLKQDRERLLTVTGRFQQHIAGLLNLFLIIANKSLLARDELGKYIVSEYGGQDQEGLDLLKERAKDRKATDYERRYAELIKLMMNWDSLQIEEVV
jgi:hypothetical protein